MTAPGPYTATGTQNGKGWVLQIVTFRAAALAIHLAFDADRPRRERRLVQQINLSWVASTDNVGVIGYQVYRTGRRWRRRRRPHSRTRG